jgi:hypothetical protein
MPQVDPFADVRAAFGRDLVQACGSGSKLIFHFPIKQFFIFRWSTVALDCQFDIFRFMCTHNISNVDPVLNYSHSDFLQKFVEKIAGADHL